MFQQFISLGSMKEVRCPNLFVHLGAVFLNLVINLAQSSGHGF
jgi:hypothetical protein